MYRMRIIGKDKEPLDLSREKHGDVFMASMKKWALELACNEAVELFDIEGVPLSSYVTAY